jgi:archaeal cell division control protein 6
MEIKNIPGDDITNTDTNTCISTGIDERESLSIESMWNTKKKIFRNKALVKVSYIPANLSDALHRSEVIRKLQNRLLDVSQGLSPNNIIIYGKPGTGKTLISTLVLNDLKTVAEKKGAKLTTIYINCEDARTENGIIGRINNDLLFEMSGSIKESIGNSKSRNNIKFNNHFNDLDGILIIILDEIDKIKDLDFVNKLIRTKSIKTSQPPCLIMITNDVKFKDYLTGHTKSVLAENEIQFSPYNAFELSDILKARIEYAFYPGVVGEMVAPLCAALAAQEHGDARKAINLLCKAGEVAEEIEKESVGEEDVREANELLDMDISKEIIRTLPTQSKVVLYSMILLKSRGKGKLISTGEIYNIYRQLCIFIDLDILTQRRVTDLISELDILGLINAVVISKGRYGRTKEISISVPLENTRKILIEDYRLRSLTNFKASIFNKMFSEF